MSLAREEYVEQTYFFRSLRERIHAGSATQDLLTSIAHELLSTTDLPKALMFLASELKLTGAFATAMAHLPHYFTPFQTYVIDEAERPEGRFDFRIALEVLERESKYRENEATAQGIFLYQFETICRNRLGYDRGLAAVAQDPIFGAGWAEWIMTVRRQIGFVDFADMIFVRSAYYEKRPEEADVPVLFGEREGKIAWANRRKDPLYLFSALARHLGYPAVPRAKRDEQPEEIVPILRRQIERLESRVKLLEEELRGGINLGRFYAREKGKKDSGK